MKLEVGKTYVFKDDAARDEYERGHIQNKGLVDVYYNDGFTLDFGCDKGGLCGTELVITDNEIHLFKESKPFDISEYEFSDKSLSMDSTGCLEIEYESWEGHQSGWCKTEMHRNINKQDAKAIARHFKLI